MFQSLLTLTEATSTTSIMNQHGYVLPKRTLLIIGAIRSIVLFATFGLTPITLRTTTTTQSLATSKMGIIHIVMFEFKEEVTIGEVKDVSHLIVNCNRQLGILEGY